MRIYDWFMVFGLIALLWTGLEGMREAYLLITFFLILVAAIHEAWIWEEEENEAAIKRMLD